ncbi:serine/threonine-protein kinase [Rhizobium oryzicola]|uniref:Serine/threonine-protein kinase n=1 Tax=Rhizobium oryzicola TaxID=1232668 RepID=A0ABT8SXB4_9HYPH|nr:serine/threonine-protein kinase [Rhizobium oryzicola]MDO1583097.1 serine/threonine-protein kinase [Rhizobium oryzicola]
MSEANETHTDRQRELALRFAALWQLLDPATDGGQAELRRTMLDQVRNALDRASGQIDNSAPVSKFIANTFACESVLAQSELSEVLLLRHRDLGTRHALKQLRRDRANDPVATAMLLHEARTLLSLNHPCIVRGHTLLRLPDGRPALLMEYCGPSVAARMAEAPLLAEDIVKILSCVLQGLSYLHQKGLAHGDISPANILKGEDGASPWKLADFCLCRLRGHALTDYDLRFAATMDFAAPELVEVQAADARSDLYSTGHVLSYLLSSCGDNLGLLKEPLLKLADTLTQPNPDLRPQSAEECLTILANLPQR